MPNFSFLVISCLEASEGKSSMRSKARAIPPAVEAPIRANELPPRPGRSGDRSPTSVTGGQDQLRTVGGTQAQPAVLVEGQHGVSQHEVARPHDHHPGGRGHRCPQPFRAPHEAHEAQRRRRRRGLRRGLGPSARRSSGEPATTGSRHSERCRAPEARARGRPSDRTGAGPPRDLRLRASVPRRTGRGPWPPVGEAPARQERAIARAIASAPPSQRIFTGRPGSR